MLGIESLVIILFGLAGSGKNFVGQILAQQFNYHYWDADEQMTDEMQGCITHGQLFTQEIRDKFTQNIIAEISRLSLNHPNLVISWALYKEKNRLDIQIQFPDALFIQVKANAKIISQRLKSRRNGVSEEYAKKIAIHYELPNLPHMDLFNDSDKTNIVNQLKNIFDTHPVL